MLGCQIVHFIKQTQIFTSILAQRKTKAILELLTKAFPQHDLGRFQSTQYDMI